MISQCQHSAYANSWSDLVCVNAPLQAKFNDNVIDVPTNFYDLVLRSNMPDEEFRVAQLIGKTLNQIAGVGYRWLFLRIQVMIQSGEFIKVSVAIEDHPYLGVIKRNRKIEVGKVNHFQNERLWNDLSLGEKLASRNILQGISGNRGRVKKV